ncbi:DNA primase [Kordiimonas sediminis]|uniref:DNA primase n=1 Tax=Kordiimonas sediminis TaxID=1735581 RepID=A0A919E6K6_9PROT|nr:DNA primase [Kordiimonas sediminis]GHF19122.1 DNA primase [Kordiimonas sediminis]
MALSPQFLDELKHRFTLSDVVGRTVKLVRRGREHTGLCPFHGEKTPSFTVNDQKGFYHCFGCGAHGGVIDFVMGTEGLTFPETIEKLAGEVGMEVPKPSREQVERDKKRSSLSEVMEMVTTWYEAQLQGAVGASALSYVRGRGLRSDTITSFRLGYAPGGRAGRTHLKDAMLARGVTEDQLIETGMVIKPESGGESYDRFRDRLMFPIADRQGRIIAFGGRALSSDVKAKYLNSPETSLFHKGATLYNWANARQAAYDTGQVMVVEGYMDVIALAEAGIPYCVAPLGTALTEEQIAHLWHMADEPILSFDGDNAGRRAATRAMDRALPMLQPGKSLRFLFMPEGEDPDTLVRKEGKTVLETMIDTADPLVSVLWQSLTDGVAVDTPERRAGLEKAIFIKLADIQDENIKKLYQGEFRDRLYQLFRPQKKWTAGHEKGKYSPRSGHGRKGQGLATGLLAKTMLGRSRGVEPVTIMIERILLLCLINHPAILLKYTEEVAALNLVDEDLGQIRNLLIQMIDDEISLDREHVQHQISESGLAHVAGKLMQDKALKGDWFAYPEAALGDAETGFAHTMARYRHLTSARSDYLRAEAEYAADMTEENQERFFAAQQVFRALEEKEATIYGYGIESNKVHEA